MDEGSWKEIDELLEGALSVEPHERAGFLEEHCRDADMRLRIQRLIAAAESDGPFDTGGAFAQTPPEDLPTLLQEAPETIPGYELRREIGVGGMGRVFEADQLEPVRRRVAVKIVLGGGDSGRVVARFEAERQTLALMNHPGIAQVYDAGMTDGLHPFFSMELVDGPPITVFCDEQRLGLRERLELFVEVCDAVQHAHQKGVIHRDLKPSNVLVTRVDGRPAPKVIDFGIARLVERSAADDSLLTEAGAVVGTPEYMSPEQAGAEAADVDTRSDVYSLGVLFYELLTGSLPFRRRDSTPAGLLELIQEVRRAELPLPSRRLAELGEEAAGVAEARGSDVAALRSSLRRDLDWITARALEKDRERRYGSVGELADDIRRYLNHEPVEACPPDLVYRLRKFALRNRGLLAASAAVFLALIVGLAGTVAGLVRAREEAERAHEQAAIAEAINEFVNEDLLAAVSPGRQGREVGMREVLDTAAARLEGRFADQPAVEASVRATLGATYFGLGELDEAGDHLARSIELYETTEGTDGIRTLEVVHVLGEIRFYQGRPDEAEALLRRAFEGRDRALGPDDPLTLSALSDLGAVAHHRGNLEEAERCYRTAYERAGGDEGEESEYTLAMIHNLGALLRDLGRLEEAEPFIRRSWEGSGRMLGEDHPETLSTLSLLASILREMGRLEDAEPISEHVYETRRRVLGDDHPSTLLSGNNLAMLYMDTGRLEEAAAVEREVLRRQRDVLGDDHDDTVLSMSNFAAILMALDRLDEAEALLDEARERCVRTLGGDHSLCGNVFRKQAECFTKQGRYAEAEPVAREGYRIVSEALGPDHPSAEMAATITARLYEAWGKPDEAAEWRRRGGGGGESP